MTHAPVIAILASLDTKSQEAEFLRDEIVGAGGQALLVDCGTRAPALLPDVAASELAALGGCDIAHLAANNDRAEAIATMMAGAAKWASHAHANGLIDAIISIGGSGGTAVGTSAMRALPFGVPKVMVSTVASSDVAPYVGTKDVTMIHSVVDFAGINPISEPILRNAAAAVVAMAIANQRPVETKDRILVAATQFGVTTQLIEHCSRLLAERGLQLVPFHATGTGGRTMEALIEDGKFVGVLDLTTTEWADEVVGGSLSAGPDRLGAAARTATPQVVAPGALDMVNFFMEPVPEKFAGRNIHKHNENVSLMRTNSAENMVFARRIAEKLNLSDGPVTFIFPLKGLSALDKPGQPFHDPEANEALRGTLKSSLSSNVTFIECDLHVNDVEFAELAVAELLKQIEKGKARNDAQDNP